VVPPNLNCFVRGIFQKRAESVLVCQLQCRSLGRDPPEDWRGKIEHDAEMQAIIVSTTRRCTRADKVSVEFLSIQCIGKRTQTAR
jgi:hypothetical protein